ncbi:MAG TPA: efflux RND transporter permease subunit, partial [Bacteroidetes bacterium]|nr:efflux RND transporter permease subunit [Bacteroidota bacterium]
LNNANIINIAIRYPGASPEEIEEGVVLKIEDNLRGLVGVDRVVSTSRENSASIVVEGFREYDIDVLLSDVKNAVDRVPSFPAGMEPPVGSKLENLNYAISFTVSGEGLDLKALKQTARKVEADLRAMEGISQITLKGFPAEEIEIAVRESDLRAYDLTFDEVTRAVANWNLLTTGGNIKTSNEEYLIRANNRNYYAKDLDFLPVRANPGGNIIRLRDIAEVRDTWSESPDRLYMNGQPAVQITLLTTNNEDIVEATEKVRDYIKKFNQRHSGVQLTVAQDRTVVLEDRIDLLLENGGLGVLLVLLLLGIFLKPGIALWVSVGLPVSMFGLFIFAPSFMTINVLSLFGLILVIGILVDDGIVISENIYYHYEQGKTPIQAAIDGTMEVGPPIVSAVLTTIVAFSTFLFLPGLLGDFFGEISIVLTLILAISLLEAFLILPAHIAHSRALKKGRQTFLINRWAEKAMLWLRDRVYLPLLHFFLRYKMIGFALPVAAFILTIGAMGGGIIKTTFFPPVASEQVFISLKMPQGTAESVTDSIISIIEQKAWEVHGPLSEKYNGGRDVFLNTVRQIGTAQGSATGPPGAVAQAVGGDASKAVLTINLKPEEERGSVTALQVANAVAEAVGPVYGVESLEYNSGSSFGGKPISVSLVSNDLQQIKAAKEELKEKLRAMPRLKDVSDNDPRGIKEIRLRLKDKAYLLGLNLNSVMRQVRAGFFGQSVQRFQRGRDEIRVWVRYHHKERTSIQFLEQMRIVTPGRARVPLSEIADYEIVRGEVAINHLNGKREIKVEAAQKNIKDSATDLVASIRENIMPGILAKYPGVDALYEGQNREAMKMQGAIGKILPPILFLMYVIIAFTFRSYTQPLMLFALIPFSLIGVAWGHWIHGMPINMLSFLGIVALIGILVNDGLVLIKRFNSLLVEGRSFDEALYQAGRQRFRAIFLTTITTVAGLAPLIFEPGFSAQFLIPMAISVAYGISFATFLTLFLLPLMLSANSKMKRFGHWLKTGKWVAPRELERAVKDREMEHST